MIQTTDVIKPRQYRFDIVARDEKDQFVLVVEVKPRSDLSRVSTQLSHYMEIGDFAYGMLVTLTNISLYQRQSANWPHPVLVLSTPDILRSYDPHIDEKQIFEFYLSALVVAWLDDLMFHWQSSEPSGAQELAVVGLLPRLVGGSTELDMTWP